MNREKEDQRILKYYLKYKNCVQVQNHVPHLSVRTVQRRVAKMREEGWFA